MKKERIPIKTLEPEQTQDGAGVKLRRVFYQDRSQGFDPFLLLDIFDSSDSKDYIKGFPWHPHRGIETITYLIRGQIEHKDSIGNFGEINEGGCQWMTAGSGIVHQEMPQNSEKLWGMQLWLNLPAKDKMTEPSYLDIPQTIIPAVADSTSCVYVISGLYKEVNGGARPNYIKPLILEVILNAGAEWSCDVNINDTLFIYILSGEASFNSEVIYDSHRAVLFSKGEVFKIKNESEELRFFLYSAPPLNEPVAWGGSIVMNTQKEVDKAHREFRTGKFLKAGRRYY